MTGQGPGGGPPSPPLVAVAITGLAPVGAAVGRQVGGEHDGRVTFVPLAAPGERVRARVVKEKARVAWAELVEIDSPSPDRVEPRCPLFGTCGGCQWQHVAPPAQAAAKKAIVERALGAAVEIEPASPTWGYRDRAKLTVGAGGEVGFLARRSHAVVDVPACPLFGPALAGALPGVRAAAARLAPGATVHLQAGTEGVAVAGALSDGPALVDVAEPGAPPLRVAADGFAQVGRAGNAALVRAVLEAVGPAPGRVVELHAGSGNFTRHLTRVAVEVQASDADAPAVERGRRNAPDARWSTAAPPVAGAPPPDTVVLDPPREGADPRSLAVAAAAARAVVYVSCDPQTLARDARALAAAGLRLDRARALDLMPHTFHVEVVARFVRADGPTGD